MLYTVQTQTFTLMIVRGKSSHSSEAFLSPDHALTNINHKKMQQQSLRPRHQKQERNPFIMALRYI